MFLQSSMFVNCVVEGLDAAQSPPQSTIHSARGYRLLYGSHRHRLARRTDCLCPANHDIVLSGIQCCRAVRGKKDERLTERREQNLKKASPNKQGRKAKDHRSVVRL